MMQTAAVRHSFVNVNGLRLHQVHVGSGGRPLVCLHGVTGHAWTWYEVAQALQPDTHVIALDMRGYGDSQWSPSGSYRTEEHISDLAGVLDALGLDEVDLAGLSWGGLVACGFASANPDRVGRLAMVDIEPSFQQSETEVPPMPRSFADHAEVAAADRQTNLNAPDSMIETLAALGTRPGEDGRLYRKHDPYFFERWPFRADDRWEQLRSLKLPVLVVNADSSFVRREICERMADETGNGRLVVIPNSGHVVSVEQPVALAEALRGFLREG